ncbi:MAG: prepilin-type N-terminal cleavage/methylation domain-containing protein [Ignavibacteria bacterium]
MCSRRASGFTLIELIVAVVVIGVGLAGVLSAFSTVVKSSADPLVAKQMLAVAEELMEEIRTRQFAVTGAAPANALTPCGAAASRAAFDDVFDYNAYATTSVCDMDGNAVGGLTGYSVSVAVVTHADLGASVPAANLARITVTVAHSGQSLTLVGWRSSYQ